MRAYEYHHTVSFEETNLIGNVYFTNHLLWQGRCREMFLRDYARDLVPELSRGFCLITTMCSCQFLSELHVFDEITVRMTLGDLTQCGITLLFECLRSTDRAPEVVARGDQRIVCMRRQADGLVPVPVPGVLRNALREFE
jgi:enediyne biosynthesis thioesterase